MNILDTQKVLTVMIIFFLVSERKNDFYFDTFYFEDLLINHFQFFVKIHV